jgi:hypothetical protein
MKKTLAVLSLVILSSLTAGFVYAGYGPAMRIDVPFDFSIQDQQFPAGQYSFEMGSGSLATSSRVTVWEADGKGVRILSTLPGFDADATVSGLRFNKYKDRYFLSSISIQGNKATLKMTDQEKHVKARIEKDVHSTILLKN